MQGLIFNILLFLIANNSWGQMGSIEAQYTIALIQLNAIISVAEMSDEEVTAKANPQ